MSLLRKNTNHNYLLLILLITTLFSACKPKLRHQTDLITISGSITKVTSSSNRANSTKVSNLSDCGSQTINLYEIDSFGKKAKKIADSNIDSFEKFTFKRLSNTEVDLKKDSENTKYLLEILCDSMIYERFVTGATEQNITPATTLIGWISQANTTLNIQAQNLSDWNEFYKQLESAESMSAAFSTLNSNTELKKKFTATFGVQPEILLDAPPEIINVSVPSSYKEENSHSLTVQSSHWSKNYNMAYEWRLNGELLSKSANFTFTPTANSQGAQTLKLFIGQNDGSGFVDTNKPYLQKTYPINIANSVLPTPPKMSIVGSQYTSHNDITVRISTGALLDSRPTNCKSFSNLALTEESFPAIGLAPTQLSAYNLTCTSSLTQDIFFSLSGEEGIRTLKLWARDESGTISSSSDNIQIIVDKTPPQLTFTTDYSGQVIKGSSNLNISWATVELNSAENSLILDYSTNNGITWNNIATNLAKNGSTTWLTPTINSTQVLLRLKTTDLSGNVGSTQTNSFTIDSTAPTSPVVTRSSNSISNSQTVSLLVTCDADYSKVLISLSNTTPLATSSEWQNCVTNMSTQVNSGDGIKQLYIFSKDLAGNVSSSTQITMTLDQTNPNISLTSLSSQQTLKSGDIKTITWTATDNNWENQKINLFYSTDSGSTFTPIATEVSNSGSYTWTVPVENSNHTKIKVTGCDMAGNCSYSISSDSLTIDSVAPTISQFILNGGNNSTMENSVRVHLVASDNFKVTQFCLKLNATPPSLTDTCWVPLNAPLPGVTPATDISFSNYFHQLGLAKGTYDVKAWIRDEAGNISLNMGALNIDHFSITYDSGTPPTISKGYVANKDNPANPISSGDSTTTSNSSIYIKWNVSDLEGLGSTPISIQYSTNEVTFLPIAGATNLINGANGSCTVDPGYTGCAVVGSPVSSYFVARIVALDNSGLSRFMTLNAMNQSNLRILAGNIDSGLGGSASSAIFNRYVTNGNAAYPAKYKLVVSDDSTIFYIDSLRGLLWVNSETGLLQTFIQTTGVSSGDGGSVASATLNSPKAIALDYLNRLLIFDKDRVRRVDLSNMTITTIIGGGATANPSNEIAASSLQIGGTFSDSGSTFVTLPNGNIIFNLSGGLKYYTYRETDHTVSPFTLTGLGVTNNPTADWTGKTAGDLGMKFNPTTSAIEFLAQGIYWNFTGDSYYVHARINTSTYSAEAPYDLPFNSNNFVVGMDGQLYSGIRYGWSFSKYNSSNNTKSVVLGTGTTDFSPCADGSIATSCKVSLSAIFVSKTGRIYFNDKGLIRTIDESGKILTLFGQYASAGDGGLATASRFGSLRDIKFGETGATYDKIIALDINSSTLREFQIGGNINKVADANFSWDGPFRFETDTATGDIFHNDAYAIKRFVRNSSTWQTVVGGGATNYYDGSGDGLVGSAIKLSNYKLSILGLINNKILRMLRFWNGTATTNVMIKAYDVSDSYRQSHFAGDAGNSINSDSFTNILYMQDPADSTNKYFWNPDSTNKIYAGTSYSMGSLFATVPHSFSAFLARTEPSGLNFYYCGTNGKLYKYNKATATETQLTWASPTLKCLTSGRSILWNPVRNTLIFIAEQNGLNAVAEYDLP